MCKWFRKKGKKQKNDKQSFFNKLKSSLADEGFLALFSKRSSLNADFYKNLQDFLVQADVGVKLSASVVSKVKQQNPADVESAKQHLQNILLEILEPVEADFEIVKDGKTKIILVVGVNGVGKTTTIGKLANFYKNQGLELILAAGDTFRAAAGEQLKTWGDRLNIKVIMQHTGADSASVLYDAFNSAQSKATDLVLADTAGRLHNKSGLMQELVKVKRVLHRLDETQPFETLMVLDATTGQNALNQVREFLNGTQVSGLVVTKLDGSAKGGILFALAQEFKIPVRFIGVGEGVDDLRPFNRVEFVQALLQTDVQEA